MTQHGPLTMSDLIALETVGTAAQGNRKVRWLLDNGDVGQGTARSIGDERGNFATGSDDIRDMFLRITSVTGFEYFIPVTHLMQLAKEGGFAID